MSDTTSLTAPAIVVGAGIGGLTAALMLASRGHAVTVIERRTGFSEVGAGIQLSPNASRILFGLGLGPALRRVATEPARVVVRRMRSGREIGEIALGERMKRLFEAPYLVVHRADLQRILLDAVRSRSHVRLLLGRTVTQVTDRPDGAVVAVERGGGDVEEIRAPLVVGADGLWSKVRAALGDGRTPEHRRAAAWRATLPRDQAPAALRSDETGLWLGSQGHVVHYPIGGGSLLNIVAIQNRRDPVEGWAAPGDGAVLRAGYGRMAEPLAFLLSRPQDWQVWSLFDLPVSRMAGRHVALLGDAAHPVLPYLAQGGALAVEDAAVLVAELGRGDAIPAALSRYAAAREPRVGRVQDHARRNGRIYHASGPIAFGRDLVMRRLGAEGMADRYGWLYGWRAA